MATCPHCKKKMLGVKAAELTINMIQTQPKGLAYCCPFCDCVLSITEHPASLARKFAAATMIAAPKKTRIGT